MEAPEEDICPIKFSQCPKYIKHEIAEDQILEIARRAVILAREDQDREIGRLTKKGLIYMIGAVVLGIYTWSIANGLVEIK